MAISDKQIFDLVDYSYQQGFRDALFALQIPEEEQKGMLKTLEIGVKQGRKNYLKGFSRRKRNK